MNFIEMASKQRSLNITVVHGCLSDADWSRSFCNPIITKALFKEINYWRNKEEYDNSMKLIIISICKKDELLATMH